MGASLPSAQNHAEQQSAPSGCEIGQLIGKVVAVMREGAVAAPPHRKRSISCCDSLMCRVIADGEAI
eukprot:6290733-Pyramimonas_sp.AAC.1